MTDDFKLQISYKLGPNNGDMLNVRATTALELLELLEALGSVNIPDGPNAIESILETGNLLRAGSAAAPLLAGNATPAPIQFPQQQAAAPAGGKACSHGQMVYREGQSARGPWKGYFCPAPKGDPGQCKAEFIR